jgi:hypothetical protein
VMRHHTFNVQMASTVAWWWHLENDHSHHVSQPFLPRCVRHRFRILCQGNLPQGACCVVHNRSQPSCCPLLVYLSEFQSLSLEIGLHDSKSALCDFSDWFKPLRKPNHRIRRGRGVGGWRVTPRAPSFQLLNKGLTPTMAAMASKLL